MHKERGREDCHNSHCLHDSRRLHTALTNKFDVHGHKQYPGHIAKVNSEENNMSLCLDMNTCSAVVYLTKSLQAELGMLHRWPARASPSKQHSRQVDLTGNQI